MRIVTFDQPNKDSDLEDRGCEITESDSDGRDEASDDADGPSGEVSAQGTRNESWRGKLGALVAGGPAIACLMLT